MGVYRDNGKENRNYYLAFRVWGHGDFVSWLIIWITRVTMWVIGVILTTPQVGSY